MWQSSNPRRSGLSVSALALAASLLLLLLLLSSVNPVQAETTSDGAAVDALVDQLISSYDVTVFAKSYCPYCKHTEKIMHEMEASHNNGSAANALGVRFVYLDRMVEDDGPLIQMELLTKTGQKTVPNIFIGGRHIGGDSDLTKLYNSGELTTMLNRLVEAKVKLSK